MAFTPVLLPDSHPDKNTLFAYINHGQLLSVEHREHVDHCPECQALLESLRTDRAWHSR